MWDSRYGGQAFLPTPQVQQFFMSIYLEDLLAVSVNHPWGIDKIP